MLTAIEGIMECDELLLDLDYALLLMVLQRQLKILLPQSMFSIAVILVLFLLVNLLLFYTINKQLVHPKLNLRLFENHIKFVHFCFMILHK